MPDCVVRQVSRTWVICGSVDINLFKREKHIYAVKKTTAVLFGVLALKRKLLQIADRIYST